MKRPEAFEISIAKGFILMQRELKANVTDSATDFLNEILQ